MSPVVILSCLSSDLMEQVVLVWFVCLGFFLFFVFWAFLRGVSSVVLLLVSVGLGFLFVFLLKIIIREGTLLSW